MVQALGADRNRVHGAGPVVANPTGFPARRRWGRLALGVGFVLVWVWGTAAAVYSVGGRTDVVAVAADVARYEPIERSDVRVARVGADDDVPLVPAGEIDDVVGRVAAVGLAAGSLLTPGDLVAEGQPVVAAEEALVGARLEPAELPAEGVQAGERVSVVVRPAEVAGGGPGDVRDIDGWLLSVGGADATTGERSVTLVVPRTDASEVSAAAADGRISVVVLGG